MTPGSTTPPQPVTGPSRPPFVTRRLPPRRMLLVMIAPGLIALGAGAVVLRDGFVASSFGGGAGGSGALAAGGAFALFFGGFGIVLIGLSLRGALLPVVLTATEVSTPGVVHGRRIVALDAASGVGLRYLRSGRTNQWRLCVWEEQRGRVVLGVPGPSFSAPKDRRRLLLPRGRSAPALDWEWVADSPAGRAALEIRGRVLAVQGPTGPLASLRREVTAEAGMDTAWWSPDGTIGPLV